MGTGGCALRALANEAAVGANRPVEGVFGRADVGVLALDGAAGRAGVLLAGVEGVLFVTADLRGVDDPVDCGLSGREGLEEAATLV